MQQLSDIREACAKLRRLPESQWAQVPRLPLGARQPHVVPDANGPTMEALVRNCISQLMVLDADRRAVPSFAVGVGAFALPDVLEALAKSVADGHGDAAIPVLSDVVAELSSARL